MAPVFLMKILFFVIISIFSSDSDANEKEVECLAKNIYYESRNEGYRGQLAVAFVTLHRVKSSTFPKTFCEVIWQRGQFEWTEDGKPDTPYEMRVYKRIKDFAKDFYFNHLCYRDPVKGAMFYHAKYVKPCWLPDANLLADIKQHLFYKVDPNGTSCWKRKRA